MFKFFIVLLLAVTVVLATTDYNCPDYSETNPPFKTRTDAIKALLYISTGRYNDMQSSKQEFLSAYTTYVSPDIRAIKGDGSDLIAPCLSSGDRLSYQVALAKCDCFPTSSETGFLSMMIDNKSRGMTF